MNDAKLNNDAPVAEPGQDRLGFDELAHHLAGALRSGGLVVGVEGKWGSGKSSLANLALKALESEREAHRPRIVRFSPWIVGNRNELLRQLFSELGSALPEYRDTRALLNRYAQSAPILAAASDLGAPVAGIPPGLVSPFFRWTGKLASKAATPSLSRQRNELRDKFRNHKNPVIVFIDDIDRLEPIEAVEVLRLVRAVADFPNVGYLLAYDPDNLAKCLQNAIGIDNGKEYIEKIVQASFRITVPANLDLRRLLDEEVRSIALDVVMTPEARDRLGGAVRHWCDEYISTPRDVARVSNSLKLYVAPVVRQIDVADALFVQIVRIRHPELHNWIEWYVQKLSRSDPDDFEEGYDSIDEGLFGAPDLQLSELLEKRDSDSGKFLRKLREHLPQASISEDVADPPDFTPQDRQRYADERRLWSPGYFRLYFALSTPAGFVNDGEVFDFLESCVNRPEAAAYSFRQFCNEGRPQGGKKGEALLARVYERRTLLTLDQIRGLLRLLGSGTDEFAHKALIRPGTPPWLHGDILDIFRLMERFDVRERKEVLKELFETAASLTMLNGIFRGAAVEHGSWGNITEPSTQKFLTDDEFQYVRDKLRERLRTADPAAIRNAPYFRNLMYGWYFFRWPRRSQNLDDGAIGG